MGHTLNLDGKVQVARIPVEEEEGTLQFIGNVLLALPRAGCVYVRDHAAEEFELDSENCETPSEVLCTISRISSLEGSL